jgi:hypothetical protein
MNNPLLKARQELKFFFTIPIYLKIITGFILFSIIFDEILVLNSFAFDYTDSYYYGKMLQGICKDSYTEYETHRLQLSANYENLRDILENDVQNSKYSLIILIWSIIISLIIIICFAIMLYTSYKDPDNSIPFDIINVAGIICGFSALAFFIHFLYVKLIISDDKFYRFDTGFNIYILFSGLIFALIVIKTFIFINSGEDVSRDYSAFVILFFAGLYILSFYIMDMVIDLYTDMNKFKIHPKSIDDNKIENATILSKYFLEIIGYNDNTDDDAKDYNNVMKNHKMQHLIWKLIIILCGLFGVYVFIYAVKNISFLNKYTLVYSEDVEYIFLFGIIPILILFLIVFTINMNKLYNTYIKQYILQDPIERYKVFMNKINSIFNEIIDNDASNIENSSVCRNTVNAFHMVIYSNIFKNNTVVVKNGTNIVEKEFVEKELNTSKDLFIPELSYVTKCDETEYIDYNDAPEYNIQTYINKNNIFFKSNKCTDINDDLLTNVILNFIDINIIKLMQDSYTTEKSYEAMIESIKGSFKIQFNNAYNNIYKQRKTYDGKRELSFNNFENNNTILKIDKIDDDSTPNKDFTDLCNIIAQKCAEYKYLMHNESIKTLVQLCRCNSVNDITNIDDLYIQNKGDYDKIIKQFQSNVYDKVKNTFKNALSINIKKDYINLFIEKTAELFQNINNNFTSQVTQNDNNYKLTQMIIKNYNNYQELNIHKFNKQKFNQIDNKTKMEDVFKDDDITDIKEIIVKLNSYYKDGKTDFDIKNYQTYLEDLESKSKVYIAQYQSASDNTKNMYEQMFYQYKFIYLENMYKIHKELLDNDNYNKQDYIQNTITNYSKINTNYNAYKKNIQGLANNTFKREAALTHQKKLDLKEEEARIIAKNAKDTSFNAYLVFVLYICILSAILIIK